MTNQESIADLETLLAYIPIYRRFYQSISMGIKALKQCDVLQNVKQEISTIPLTDTDGHNGNWFREPQAIIEDVNVIIDKFINEVEQ